MMHAQGHARARDLRTLDEVMRRLELSAEIARHTGDGHDLTRMVLGGYSAHHHVRLMS